MKILRIILLGIFVVAALAYLNVVIPQPQTTQARTFLDEHPDYNGAQMWNQCGPGNLKLVVSETPACTSSVADNMNNYTGKVTASVDNIGNYEYKIDWKWTSYFCQNAHAGGCNQNPQSTGTSQIISGSDHATFNTIARTTSCGTVQNDFGFVASYRVKGSNSGWTQGCSRGDFGNLAGTNATFTWCTTNNSCSAPTPTPTATPTPTVTPTPTPAYHLACQSFACVKKPGANLNPGETGCTAEATTSSECSHLTCINNSCERAPYPGASTCTTEGGPCSTNQQHLACKNYACVMVPGAGAPQCTTEPNSCAKPPHLKIIKMVNNNHGGTKQASDFSIHVKNGSSDVAGSPAAGSTSGKTYLLTAGDYTVSEDDVDGYHQVSISGDCDSTGHVHLKNGDNKTCVIENEDNGGGSCTMPTCNTDISGCSYPYPDTKSCSCGPLVCITNTPSCSGTNCGNININVNQSQNQQQQQQQAVLGASVAPAVNASQLPSTGAGAEVLLSLLGLLPVGFKLRKLI